MFAEFYLAQEYWFAATQLFLAMLGMGATLKLSDFTEIVREPKAVVLGLSIQILIVPLLAWMFIKLSGLGGGVAVGLAICAAVPGGTMSNIFTLLSRGNVPLSIVITALTALLCLLTTPLVLNFLVDTQMPENFQMPASTIASEMVFTLLVPLLLGMVVYRWQPQFAGVFSTWCIRCSLVVIALIVLGSVAAGRIDVQFYGLDNVAYVVLFVALMAVAGWGIPFVSRFARPDRIAIGTEVMVRNTNLGLLVKTLLFPFALHQHSELANLVLLTVLLYGGLMLIFGFLSVSLCRRVQGG